MPEFDAYFPETDKPGPRTICWFSCGVTSAVSAAIAVKNHSNIEVVYCDTGGEHESNKRFLDDVSQWIDHPIKVLKNKKYKDHFDVFEKTKFISSPYGARCTVELKKRVREDYQRWDDTHIFGFSIEEEDRVTRLRNRNPELNLEFNLIDHKLSKSDCLAIVTDAGIELPQMYKLGYGHNNCIGCPNGQQGYWNKIRVDFPDTFARMAKIERKLDVAINKSYAGDGKRKRVFLDELDPNVGRDKPLPPISCSMFCAMTEIELDQ